MPFAGVGTAVGPLVGAIVGVGAAVGPCDGTGVGPCDGTGVGAWDGTGVGPCDGNVDGADVGADGTAVGEGRADESVSDDGRDPPDPPPPPQAQTPIATAHAKSSRIHADPMQ